MAALQHELDHLQNERRELREKLRNSTKEAIINRINSRSDFLGSNGGVGGGGGAGNSTPGDSNRGSSLMLGGHHQLASADTLPLIYEINMMRSVNRLLQKSMMELNRQCARSLCEKFSHLPAIEKTTTSASRHDGKVNEDKEEVANQNLMKKLSKQSNELMVDVFNSLGTYKVENLRNRSSRANENRKNNINLLMVGFFVLLLSYC